MKTKVVLSDAFYSALQNIVKLILPGLSAFYFALASIWNLPYAEQIVGTLAALAVFLGVILKLGKATYDSSDDKYHGEFVVDTVNPEKDVYSVDFHGPLMSLGTKNEILLKVRNVDANTPKPLEKPQSWHSQ